MQQPDDSYPSYGGGCARRAREPNTPYSRPSSSECHHAAYTALVRTGSAWMGFDDPQFGPSLGYREYKVYECAACGERFGIAPEGMSSCALTGL